MKYKEIIIAIDGSKLIAIQNEDGSVKLFSKDDNNPEYLNFKEHIDEYELVKESE